MNALALALLLTAQADTFPHAAHRRLFVTCTTCHAGILSGDSATTRPAAPTCASCHDGTIASRVQWSPAPPRPTSLRFDHRSHTRTAAARGDSLPCAACHAQPGGGATAASLMQVGRARPEMCLSCHAHRAPSHFAATADCTGCHRPLAQATRLAASDIARIPRPPTHDSGFIARHGDAPARTCATCHTRESCEGCHVNARAMDRITSLGSNRHVAQLLAARGADAPRRPQDHVPGFAVQHRGAAAAGERTCGTCHTPSFCSSCHDAAVSPGFHGANYVMRHGGESFGTATECSACHQPETFCTACHQQSGRASPSGAQTGAYHDAQSRWRFAHGAVARRAIESCAGCHRQSDCLACHSATRGQGVSPHGQRFNTQIEQRNPAMCATCHGVSR